MIQRFLVNQELLTQDIEVFSFLKYQVFPIMSSMYLRACSDSLAAAHIPFQPSSANGFMSHRSIPDYLSVYNTHINTRMRSKKDQNNIVVLIWSDDMIAKIT